MQNGEIRFQSHYWEYDWLGPYLTQNTWGKLYTYIPVGFNYSNQVWYLTTGTKVGITLSAFLVVVIINCIYSAIHFHHATHDFGDKVNNILHHLGIHFHVYSLGTGVNVAKWYLSQLLSECRCLRYCQQGSLGCPVTGIIHREAPHTLMLSYCGLVALLQVGVCSSQWGMLRA